MPEQGSRDLSRNARGVPFCSSALDRLANIPEFVNADPGAIKRIRQRFVDDASYLRGGQINARYGYHDVAARACELTGYRGPAALLALSEGYAEVGRFSDALSVARRALAIGNGARSEAMVRAVRLRIEFYRRQPRADRRPASCRAGR